MILFSSLFNENKPFLGTFIQTASPEFLEAAGYAGFRFAAIDLEHASYGTETLVHMIRAGEAAGMSMLARVPALDTVWIKKSLDMGASGIIVPNIDTPEQAYGAGGSEYYRLANENTAVIPLVESAEGVRNFAEIVHTPGISAVFLGPVDLSVSMGLCGDLDAPEVKDALLSMIRLANAAGVPVGALGLDPVFVKKLFREGLDFLAYGIDTILCAAILFSLSCLSPESYFHFL